MPDELDEPINADPPGPGEKKRGFPWGCFAVVAIVAVFVAGSVAVSWMLLHKISGILPGFREEQITETFLSSVLEVTGTQGGTLEVSTATSTERFERHKENLIWNFIPWEPTISEIVVPATYRYHIDLNGKWDISVDEERIIVVAPKIEPSLPVAFDTAGMKKKTLSSWQSLDKQGNLEELEKAITSRLNLRAASPENIKQVREESRRSVAMFVKNWLLSAEHWQEGRYTEITVIFEDELKDQEKADSLKGGEPTIRMITASQPKG